METQLESEITESWKMLLGLNTEPLLKPSVGKWELGTRPLERIRSQVRNEECCCPPPLRKLYNYRMRRGRGHTWGGHTIRHETTHKLVSDWSMSHNAGLWLVMTLPRLPRTGSTKHMLHALNISTQLSNGQVLYQATLNSVAIVQCWESYYIKYQLWARINYKPYSLRLKNLISLLHPPL